MECGIILFIDIDDSPLTMMQLLKDLNELGFDADFSLAEGLELTIRKQAITLIET